MNNSDNDKPKMGRPRKDIELEEVIKLCNIQCTLIEIAGFFGVSIDTIERRVKEWSGQTFAEFYDIHRAPGRVSLRRQQFKKALEDGNTHMLKWLGIQYLGQKNQHEVTGSVPVSSISPKDILDIIESGQHKKDNEPADNK